MLRPLSSLTIALSLTAALAACSDEPTQPTRAATSRPARTTATGPVLTVTPDSFDFGSVFLMYASDPHTFTVENTGTDLLYLTTALELGGPNAGDFRYGWHEGEGCSYGGEWGWPVGRPCYFGLYFAPTDTGRRTATATINSKSGSVVVKLSGTGVAKVAIPKVIPETWSFGDQEIGTASAPKAIQVWNVGWASLLIKSFSFGTPGDFQLANTSMNACQPTGSVSPQGGACEIMVTYAPSTIGSSTATLYIETNVGTISATLSGNGVRPKADLGVAMSAALQGKVITYDIVVKNAGPSAATGVALTDVIPNGATYASLSNPSDVVCTTPNAGDAGAVKCSIASLAAGASRTLQLTVKVAGTNRVSITNSATVNASGSSDPAMSNNTASVTSAFGRR